VKVLDTPLSTDIFWDAEMSVLDTRRHMRYIVTRVMDRGTLEDVRYVMKLYGRSQIKKILIQAPNLDYLTISFFANYFEIPKTDFVAYSRKEQAKWHR
jgi:hypothetical protein